MTPLPEGSGTSDARPQQGAQNSIPEATLQSLQQAARRQPGDAAAFHELGLAYGEAGRLQEAAAAFREALRLDPNLAEAHINWGVALLRLGQTDAALRQHRRGVRLWPSASAYYNLGCSLYYKGDWELAIENLQRACRLGPSDADRLSLLGSALFKAERATEAIAAYQEAIRLQPGDGDLYYNLGLACFHSGLLGAAVDAYLQAVRLCPEDHEARFSLGMLLVDDHFLDKEGIIGQGIEEFREAARLKLAAYSPASAPADGTPPA